MMREAQKALTVAGLVACCLIHAAAVASPPAAVCGRAFVLADRGSAAPFFLGQDDPVSARSAVDAVIREVKARSGATLKPFAVQSNPKAGYLFASVQRWTDEKAYFARIEHGILEIHGSTEEALAEALSVFTERYVKSAKGPRLAWESVAFAYGPQPDEVRERTDALDSLGNTTAATGKGFAIGSASLTALALLVSYVNIVQERTDEVLNFTLTSPTVLVGLFIGAMLTFVFSALTMEAVQTAAQSIVVEVRRQFREIEGIMEFKTDPDYASCVALCTKGALREMVVPALIAIVVPLATGLILGPTGVVGLLGGVSVTGFAMAVFMSNAGGAWDNAKKYIESGHHGGKGSYQHKAAVVGDTVGDPFKDTSGPSLNILIKLCSTVSIVFSGLVLTWNLISLL